MKIKLLALMLTMFSCYSLFAQTITGEKNPCPGTPYIYEITLPPSAGIPYATQFDHTDSFSMTSVVSGTNITYRFSIVWANYYETVGGSAVHSTFQLTNAMSINTKYEIRVIIKGLSDIQWSTVPSLSCGFRGNTTVSVTPVSNATSFTWSNDAGWIGDGSSGTSTVFNVNNGNTANITVTAHNSACNVSKNNVIKINRPAVTTTPVFASALPDVICPSTSYAVTVTGAESTPFGYEWYALPAGYVNINGGSYSSESAPLTTTTTGVTLTYGNTTQGAGQPVTLFARAIYTQNCKSPFLQSNISTGVPTVQTFSTSSSTGDSFDACPSAVVQITPTRNTLRDDILEHKWEVVSGSYSSLTGGEIARLRVSSQLNVEVELRYRYRTSCGWSNWLTCYVYTVNCSGLRKEQTADTVVSSATGFSISPNPASTEINVNLPYTSHTNTLSLTITNIKGNTLIRRTLAKTSKFNVDVSSLPSGNYILQIQSGTKKYSKQFVVVK